jgi:nitrous oxidase accessory protein NosD
MAIPVLAFTVSAVQAATADTTPDPSSAACPSLQRLVDSAESGSTVRVEPCVYRETITIRKPLTLLGHGATISGRDPDGPVVRDRWVVIAASDVTIEGFAMRDAANDPQTGAVEVEAGVSGFTLRDCDLAGASGANVSFGTANDSVVEGCAIHEAGQLGVHMGGDDVNGRNNVVRNNEIYGNNTAGFDPEWEAGGLKATRQRNLVVEGNEVRNNAGPGVWCDILCRDIVVRNNDVHDNTYAGIFFELGQGAQIQGNRVWANGWGKPLWGWGAGILVSSSGGARVVDNVVAWNHTGISVISQDRSDWPYSPVDNAVLSNVVIGDSDLYLEFWAQDWDGELFRPASGNEGGGGRYWIPGGRDAQAFQWDGRSMALPEYEATSAGAGGTVIDDAERDAVLIEAGIQPAPDHAPAAMKPVQRLVILGTALAALLSVCTALLLLRRRRWQSRADAATR